MKQNALNDDNAMNYEFLLRTSHNCGRGGVAGADADTFRRLIRVASMYSTTPNENTSRSYFTTVGEIAGYVKTAIDKVLSERGNDLDEAQRDELSDLYVELTNLPDIDTINDAVEKAQEIFLAIGLKVGS